MKQVKLIALLLVVLSVSEAKANSGGEEKKCDAKKTVEKENVTIFRKLASQAAAQATIVVKKEVDLHPDFMLSNSMLRF